MTTFRFAVGDLVTSGGGVTLGQVTELVNRDPRWKTSGYRVLRLNQGRGDGYGFTEFWAGYLSIEAAPTEWTPAIGSSKFEYRWVSNGSIWTKEYRERA